MQPPKVHLLKPTADFIGVLCSLKEPRLSKQATLNLRLRPRFMRQKLLGVEAAMSWLDLKGQVPSSSLVWKIHLLRGQSTNRLSHCHWHNEIHMCFPSETYITILSNVVGRLEWNSVTQQETEVTRMYRNFSSGHLLCQKLFVKELVQRNFYICNTWICISEI